LRYTIPMDLPAEKLQVPIQLPKPLKYPLRLKPWTFAGLMITYWCNAQCSFCYVYSGPQRRGGEMAPDLALHLWRGLNALLPPHQPCQVHIAGGEPFQNFPRLLTIVQSAHDAGLHVLEKVETNAFWAVNDDETRLRIRALAQAGVGMLAISCDIYHQEFVPVERCARAARIAAEELGPRGVRVRWWDYLRQPQDISNLTPDARRQLYARSLLDHHERLIGRAADELADCFLGYAPEAFAQQHCYSPTLGSKHVHIDGYGHVFPGVCSGIIWGTIRPTAPTPDAATATTTTPWPVEFPDIPSLWHYAQQHWRNHPVMGRVVEHGSYALFQYAQTLGYQARPQGYANKCHLCHDVRRWLHGRGHWAGVLGPTEVYHELPPAPGPGQNSLPILGS
jgi:hypothetical protein